jgi:hypothetical protein
MRHRIITLSSFFLTLHAAAQIPLTITEFDYSGTPVIDMAVGDLDANGRDDIYLIATGEDRIIKLNNLGNGIAFTGLTYLALPGQPEALGTVSLNGGDDLFYVLTGQSGMRTLFGRDPWITEKTEGPTFFETVPGIRQVNLQPFNYSQVLVAADTARALHFAQIVQGSFNSVGILSTHRMLSGGLPGEIGGFTDGDTLDFFVPDAANGQLKRTRIGHDAFYMASYEDDLSVIDAAYESPVAALSYSDSTGLRLVFVLDTADQTLSKLVFQNGSFVKTAVDVSLTDMRRIGLGYLDDDPHVDLVIANGNELWMLSNAPQRSLSLAPTLITTYDKPVGQFFLTDFNADGIDDIVSLPEDGTSVLVSRNEILSATGDPVIPAFGYWPNPAQHTLFFPADRQVDEVRFTAVDGRTWTLGASSGRIDISRLPAGLFAVSTRTGDVIYQDRIVITVR